MIDLTGHVALVTGGRRGLGRAFAQALLSAGVRVAIPVRSAPGLYDTASRLTSAADQVREHGVDTKCQNPASRLFAVILKPVSIVL